MLSVFGDQEKILLEGEKPTDLPKQKEVKARKDTKRKKRACARDSNIVWCSQVDHGVDSLAQGSKVTSIGKFDKADKRRNQRGASHKDLSSSDNDSDSDSEERSGPDLVA